jgi:hypothetical protein
MSAGGQTMSKLFLVVAHFVSKPGAPVGINCFIGRRPIFAFGNSDGDQQMLEWTAAGDGARLMARQSP